VKRKKLSVLLSLFFLLPVLFSLGGCAEKSKILRVYNWEEYIDEGDEGSYVFDTLKEELAPELSDKEFKKWYKKNVGTPLAPAMIDDFENWYEETYGEKIRVEYSTFGTNEDLYNQLKLGDKYDLVCPSEYMIMKLAAEGMLEPLGESFFDANDEHNYYINNVSPFIRNVFESGTMGVPEAVEADGETITQQKSVAWSEYAAGYMWGTTGLIFNPDGVTEDDLAEGWNIMLDKKFHKKVTTKDNVRDSYFVGLGILYRDELLSLDKDADDYNEKVTEIFNRTDAETVKNVQKVLLEMKENIFGFETDTGKSDMIKGTILLNFAWSGDAVYAMDEAENKDVTLNFHIPDEGANLFFDGWVMPKGASKKEAQAFINFMSRPDNAVRNSYSIGYTSVIAGQEMLDYATDTYSAEDESAAVPYDVSYFFGTDAVIYADEEQLSRQLYAQYPPENTMKRCAVMNYYGKDEEPINELWTQVKGEKLDAWAIVVIVVAVLIAVLAFVLIKFGKNIEFRRKPKKGYVLTSQKEIR